MRIQLDGKRALVTGGNSGIGAAVALALAEAGARVAINYVSHREAAQALLERLRTQKTDALLLEADVSHPEAVQEMFRRLDQSWGGIDLLVNNAGIDGERAVAWEADPEQWIKVIQVNLFGAFHCARQALQRMVPRKNGGMTDFPSFAHGG